MQPGDPVRGYQIRKLKLVLANLHKSITQTPATTVPPMGLRPNATDMGSLFIVNHASQLPSGPITLADPSLRHLECQPPTVPVHQET